MTSLRSKFWSVLISQLVMKIGTITKPTDIRREMSSDTIPFLNNIWKKEQYIEYTNYFIDNLEMLVILTFLFTNLLSL